MRLYTKFIAVLVTFSLVVFVWSGKCKSVLTDQYMKAYERAVPEEKPVYDAYRVYLEDHPIHDFVVKEQPCHD